jgi:hypothetical protein
MLSAKIVLFCFGKTLEWALQASVRPRNLTIVEYEDKFVISFLDTPNPSTAETIKNWIFEVVKNG